MDPKKQELNPDLKEIYERVMNTPVKKPEDSGASPSGATPAPTPPPAPQAPPAPTMPTPGPAPMPEATPPPPPLPSAQPPMPDLNQITSTPPGVVTPTQTQAAPPVSQPAPQSMPMPGAAPMPPISGAAQPSAGAQPFVFKDGKVAGGKTASKGTAKSGITGVLSGKVIAVLLVMLLAVWGVFWAKIFGLF